MPAGVTENPVFTGSLTGIFAQRAATLAEGAQANGAALAPTVVAARSRPGPDPGCLRPSRLGHARHWAARGCHLRGSGPGLCPRARRPTPGGLGRAPVPLTT